MLAFDMMDRPNRSEKEMLNNDMSNHWLAISQMEKKTGFPEYEWGNPGETVQYPKALYMAYFEPWDWIVSVSSYKSEYISLCNIDKLRSDILSFGADKAGSGNFNIRAKTDAYGDIMVVNQAFSDITGYQPEEVLGENPRLLKSDRHDATFYEKMWQDISTRGHWVGEIWNRR